jgi:hypothetical protein
VKKANPNLKLSFLLPLSEWMKVLVYFLLLICLRSLIVVLYVLNVGVLDVHFMCIGVAFLCYFNVIYQK